MTMNKKDLIEMGIGMISSLKENFVMGVLNQKEFDAEVKQYCQLLLGMGADENDLNEIFKACKMNIEINVWEVHDGGKGNRSH